MRPILFQYGSISVASYPLFYGLGLGLAGLTFAFLMRRSGVEVRRAIQYWFFVTIAVVLGGRILYLIICAKPNEPWNWSFLSLESGGEVLYGSLLSGIAVAWILARRWRISCGEVLDAGAICAPIGIAVGRIGCLLEGCCHGTLSKVPWTMQYPKVIDPEGNIVGSAAFVKHLEMGVVSSMDVFSAPVHPVQIYEFFTCTLIAAFMFVLWKAQWLKYQLILLFVSMYCTWRFVAEFFRVEERSFFGLTVYQILSVTIGASSMVALVHLRSKWRLPPGEKASGKDSGERRKTSGLENRGVRRSKGRKKKYTGVLVQRDLTTQMKET